MFTNTPGLPGGPSGGANQFFTKKSGVVLGLRGCVLLAQVVFVWQLQKVPVYSKIGASNSESVDFAPREGTLVNPSTLTTLSGSSLFGRRRGGTSRARTI